jgi:hypothetical protein
MEYDDAIQKVGSMGKFQIYALYVTIVNFIAEGMAIYSLAFLTKVPRY